MTVTMSPVQNAQLRVNFLLHFFLIQVRFFSGEARFSCVLVSTGISCVAATEGRSYKHGDTTKGNGRVIEVLIYEQEAPRKCS